MQQPISFYESNLSDYTQKQKTTKKQLYWSSLIRLFVFMLFGVLIYYSPSSKRVIMGLVGIIIFLFLVKKHGVLKEKNKKLLALIKINKTEIKIITKNALDQETGNTYRNPKHEFSYDIDLFGKGSFFQYLNRTVTKSGENYLADLLNSNTIYKLLEKQKAISELAKKATWRQDFSATAMLIDVQTNTSNIRNWFREHKRIITDKLHYIPTLFLIISSVLILLASFEIIATGFATYWFLFGLGISSLYFKKVSDLSRKANTAKATFRQYHQLIAQIENTKFQSKLLVEKQNLVINDKEKASDKLKDFSKHLDALDQRNNMIFGIVANGLALWDIKQTYKIEKWIEANNQNIDKWFETIAFFDAYNSLGNFAYNHPDYTTPVLTNSESTLISESLGHPLLDKSKRVDNNFNIDTASFYIITGANMAGKSTFLRTVSLSLVMANIGLPVAAKSFEYKPIKLITSMRTTDSLSEDESYFFAELKRLKFIIDAIEKETYFIVLDEILKGTNSTDKAIGSRKFVNKLVQSHSTGIIATHDLSLCEITQELKQVKNYYFDAEIVNDELYFDYKLKDGICQNMNASFLLKKMEII